MPSTTDITPPKPGRKTTIAALVVYPPVGLIMLWCMDRFSKNVKLWATAAGIVWFLLFTAVTAQDGRSSIAFAVVSLLAAGGCIAIWHRHGRRYIERRYAGHPKRQLQAAAYVVFFYFVLLAVCWIPVVGAVTDDRSTRSAAAASTAQQVPEDPEAEMKAAVEKIAKSTFGSRATVDVYRRPEGSTGAGFYSVEAHYKTIMPGKRSISVELRRFYIASLL